MGGFARGSFLATLSLLGLSLTTGASAQTSKAREAAPEHRKPVDVFDHIEGELTVLKRKPAGTVVRRGAWVVEFDSADLRDALTRQGLAVTSAEAAYRAAALRREAAEVGVKESVAGMERAKTSRSAADRLVLTGAQVAEEGARAEAILVKCAEAKKLKELEGEVFKAKEEELRMEAALLRERSKEERLRRDIAACKVVVPIDGVVGYLRPVGEEDTFREGEVVFRIFPEPTPRPGGTTTGPVW
jgi:hypothetical protein